VLSIEAQLREVRDFARSESLDVAHEFVEKQSAKIPGRPIFNEMLKRIEAGEASGILAWHPDRLARNSIDGGRIIFLLDTGKIRSLKFPRHWFENTLRASSCSTTNSASQSITSIRSLKTRSEGFGESASWRVSGVAPLGYLNDYRTKRIIVDRERGPLVKQAFEMYAMGNETLDTMRKYFAEHLMLSRNQKLLGRNFVSRVLSNPFYYGHFRYCGEIYEGKQEALITKKLFDEVQSVLKGRARTSPQTKHVPKVFLGLLRCAGCGGAITAEIQKGHTYYRCTKKNRIVSWCAQPYVREEALAEEITALLAPFCLCEQWATQMLEMLKVERHAVAASSSALHERNQAALDSMNARQQRLLDSYLDGVLDRETYLAEKAKIMSNKKSLEEQSPDSVATHNSWLEPFENWLKEAGNAGKVVETGSLHEKKKLASKIFGSNLLLDRKKARGSATKPWSLLLETPSCSELVRLAGLEPANRCLRRCSSLPFAARTC
jgi:hypothetical protein